MLHFPSTTRNYSMVTVCPRILLFPEVLPIYRLPILSPLQTKPDVVAYLALLLLYSAHVFTAEPFIILASSGGFINMFQLHITLK